MSNEQIGELQFILQLNQKIDDLGLHRNIEGRGGLVEDNEGGLGRQGPGDGNQLPLPPAYGTGILMQVIRRQLDHLQKFENVFLPARPIYDPVNLDRQFQNLSDALSGIERGSGILENDLNVFLKFLRPRARSRSNILTPE